jgi:hypothetical protein
MSAPQKKDVLKLATFLIICIVLILVFGTIAYTMSDSSSVLSFLGVYPFPTVISIVTGMMANIVFGMIDNGGLFFGMSALDPFLPKGELTRAGLGNTFSDGLGAFLGSFTAVIIKSVTKVEDTPLWADAFGIVIGCLIGLYLPRYVTGKV